MPLLVAATMGYGHLRAAWALADRLGLAVLEADRPPLAPPAEARSWARYRVGYELLSRLSQHDLVGRPFSALLDRLTALAPIAPGASAPDGASRRLARLVERGLGRTLVRRLAVEGQPLLTTFYAPAVAAARHRLAEVYCVVTDTEVHRVWVPVDPRASRVRYLTPCERTAVRLVAYGVPTADIHLTGFPLPALLTASDGGGIPRHAAARLVRLGAGGAPACPEPLTVVVAVGGAGAQAGRAVELVAELAQELASGALRLVLVAGLRLRLARSFERLAGSAPEGAVEVVAAASFEGYYRSFNRALLSADVLWTKPSELVFYGAVGLPLLLDTAVGDHERANARWALEAGVALERPPPGSVADALARWRVDGALAQAARAGLERLPRHGAEAIAATLLERT